MNKISKEINLISIKDNQLKIRYEESVFASADTHLITYQNTAPVHPDLNAAMQLLSVHVSRICGFIASYEEITVTGYQRQNMGDVQLLTIYAHLEADGTASLAARLYLGRDEYDDIDLLLEALSCCEREAFLYVEKGKTFNGEKRLTLDDEDLKLMDKAA